MKLAVLSNVNVNFMIRMLKKSEHAVFESEGYGNELGAMLDPASPYHVFDANITFVITYLPELLCHDFEIDGAKARIREWFETFENCLRADKIYYVADAHLRGADMRTQGDPLREDTLMTLWNEALSNLMKSHANVRMFPYRRLVSEVGERAAFSEKTWYMGKIPFSSELQKSLVEKILHCADVEARTPKKVLILDLDNTLWGGLAGEADHTPVELSEDHTGLAYKDLQRVLLAMKEQGVILTVVSKNNAADALAVMENNPHMVLKKEDFAALYINWEPKSENIRRMAEELNLGLSSFVFFDDSALEREEIRQTLPEVMVPDFPEKPEELPETMQRIHEAYFEKAVVTAEDAAKTRMYRENAKRNELQRSSADYESYLKSLEIRVIPADPKANFDRLLQLLNKTNQFNLTTRRFTAEELSGFLDNPKNRCFLYQVADKFGDNGIVTAVLTENKGDTEVITEFVMSCRVMGRRIEDGILTKVEDTLFENGAEKVMGEFIPSSKNAAVASLYSRLGYADGEEIEGVKTYILKNGKRAPREFYGTFA